MASVPVNIRKVGVTCCQVIYSKGGVASVLASPTSRGVSLVPGNPTEQSMSYVPVSVGNVGVACVKLIKVGVVSGYVTPRNRFCLCHSH